MPLWGLWAFLAFALVVAIAAHLIERVARRGERSRLQPPGTLVEIGGRGVHLLCKGEAQGPTVVFEMGAAEPSMLWWTIQDAVSTFARTCTYDRAGYQWSDPAPTTRSITERANELRQLLSAAGIAGPYVLVSHSYGGAIARAWIRKSTDDIDGLVFVDTPDEELLYARNYRKLIQRGRLIMPIMALAMRLGVFRLMSSFNSGSDSGDVPLSPAARHYWPMAFTPNGLDAAYRDLISLANATPNERTPIDPGALGDLPVAVVTHGVPFPGPFASLEIGFHDSQRRLAALSSRGELIVAKHSNHNINTDEPEIVVEAIRRVLEKARRVP